MASKLIQYRIDYVLSNGVYKYCYVTGKNGRNAITNALINKIEKTENADISKMTVTKVWYGKEKDNYWIYSWIR